SSQIDLQNAADYFIFINVLAAMDNRGKNYFLVRQTMQSPWFFVPWDLDLTAGMCFPAQHKDVIDRRMYNQLFRRLMTCPEFVQAIGVRWSELRGTLFETENLKLRYRQNYQSIAGGGAFDRRQYCPQFKTHFDTPENEIASIEKWIDARIEFLDGWFGNTARLVKRLQKEKGIRTANSTSDSSDRSIK
ncbi:CotH kinase family protein, partial [bacterium]|nr:CotH kinase family protein [bacterium]